MARRFSCWLVFGLLALSLPAFAAPNLVGAKSRKLHATAGNLDIAIDVSQPVSGFISIEPREIGSGHLIVFQFDAPISAVGAATLSDALGNPLGSVSPPTFSGSEVLVPLSGIPNNTRTTVSVSAVNGSTNATVSVGFLAGDVDSDGTVSASDVSAVKARSGLAATAVTAAFDVNGSGSVNAVDISAVKANLGQTIPPLGQASLMLGSTGNGLGSVTSNPGALSCPGACAGNISLNTVVTITASPAIGSTFVAWAGDCSGTNPVTTLTLVRSSTCTAQFSRSGFLVTPQAGSNGAFSPSTPQTILFGDRAVFTAIPNPGFVANFGGTCGGSVGSNVYMTNPISGPCTVTATFVPAVTTLSWDPVVDARLAGYRVYYGNSPGVYLQLAGQGINVGNATSYALTALGSGTYYFAVKAYDANGVESGFSNEVNKIIQ